MKTLQESTMKLSGCNQEGKKFMRRLFRKGDRVRSKIDGKVVEVLKYIKKNLVEVMWFDMEKKEPRKNTIEEDKLSKAA